MEPEIELPCHGHTPQEYKNHLEEFGEYLKSDWKRWAVMQIKQAMMQGKTTIYLFNLGKKDWIKAKNIKNFWKKENILPPPDQKYYRKEENVLITNVWLRNVIDFLDDIGVQWFPVATQAIETLTMKYNQIHAIIKYPRSSKVKDS